jgi:hypothetical protein
MIAPMMDPTPAVDDCPRWVAFSCAKCTPQKNRR